MTAPTWATLAPLPLPPGVRSRCAPGINGMTVHLLEAGHGSPGRPAVLLLHGFPELAYSWRRVMPALADAGYHVIAPDQRGYGRSTGWDGDYDGDLGPFRLLNLVRDALALVAALGLHEVAAVVGHDFGSPVAAWCALVRPDVFRSVVLMSAPFGGPPALPFNTAPAVAAVAVLPDDADLDIKPAPDIHAQLAALPRPRKHYQWHYATRGANADLVHCPQGLHALLRAYYHCKSADWPGNTPHALLGWRADELALLPTYYVMDLDQGMAGTVAPHMPSAAQIAACRWLPDTELAVYSSEFARTGFQGGLQWYRCRTDGRFPSELQLYSGRSIDVPALFIAGQSDWGPYQKPGDFEAMRAGACSQLQGCHLIEGAGHWVQQEQPEAVSRLLLDFLRHNAPGG
jgi:pimeloyl-ACP methyl ester carboxylesterase